MTPTTRCPDCGQPTTLRLCAPCTDVADSLGHTVDQRLAMLGTLPQEDPA